MNKKGEQVRLTGSVHKKLMEKKYVIYKKTGMSVSMSWIILQMIKGKKFRSVWKI